MLKKPSYYLIFLVLSFMGVIQFSFAVDSANRVTDSTKVKTVFRESQSSKSATDRIEALEKKVDIYNSDKELWGNSLERANVLFTVINALILLIAGLGYFALFRNLIKSIETKIEVRMSELEYRQHINESLVYRTMYFNCVATNQFGAAILWASRVILKEAENPRNDDMNTNRIHSFIKNMQQLVDDHIGVDVTLDPREITEVVDNYESVAQICKNKLSEEMYQSIKAICSKIYGYTSNTNQNTKT